MPFGRLDDGPASPSHRIRMRHPRGGGSQLPLMRGGPKAKERLWMRRPGDPPRSAQAKTVRRPARRVRGAGAGARAADQAEGGRRRRGRSAPSTNEARARTLNFALVSPVPKPPQKFTYDFPFAPRHSPTRTPAPFAPSRRDAQRANNAPTDSCDPAAVVQSHPRVAGVPGPVDLDAVFRKRRRIRAARLVRLPRSARWRTRVTGPHTSGPRSMLGWSYDYPTSSVSAPPDHVRARPRNAARRV
ncbi:hypothetical protein C8R47DRAFT_98552 [Mycena vitilis]|nr:hypothetical protein C8R47DRAFT_98552 [Mycena vitilis]